jgi:hypothetical protein
LTISEDKDAKDAAEALFKKHPVWVSNNIDPYTGVRRKCFALWKKIDSLDTQAYLNRAALVGCKNQALSENYAKRVSNNIDPYTGVRRKCFALWKNQFSLLIKCRNNTGIGVFFKQC